VTPEDRGLDLSGLSPADKDRIIRDLWEDLRAERAKVRALEQRAGADRLRDELRRQGTAKRTLISTGGDGTIRLGRGLRLLGSRTVLGILLVAGLLLALDLALGWYEQHRIDARRAAELSLQKAAFDDLLVELKNITYEPDGASYRITLALRNLDPAQPIYVMLNPLRVFAQSGLAWREVPARSADGRGPMVVKLTDGYSFQTVFAPNSGDWTSALPGYLHIRFDNDLLISLRSDPAEDIVERDDPAYVYLKPFGADDAALSKALNFSGTPPVYIPMPPH
jgi:hypothetical protein